MEHSSEKLILLQSNDSSTSSLLAFGIVSECVGVDDGHDLNKLQQFIDDTKDWCFGYLSYDLKNQIEELHTSNPDQLFFHSLHFIQPKLVAEWKNDELIIHYFGDENEADALSKLFSDQALPAFESPKIKLQADIPSSAYLRDIMSLKSHIQQGDIYEINYCMQFAATGNISAYDVWRELNRKTKAPFASFVQLDPHYLLCASPERYLRREGNRVVSQPIKGTQRRSTNQQEDLELIEALRNDPKERAENIMITDLVRNDLSKSAENGSVKVDQLCEVHSFQTVHQLISTVSCTVPENCSFTQLIKDTFPMGSMTGAPKISAMKLIESHEKMQRGLYSGSVGYIRPNGDFDFNVVIRSILYNREKNYLSAMVGGAITAASQPESEYQECLLKAQALLTTLS